MDVSRNWLQGPCAFYLSRSYATKCCACDKPFGFMNRGHTCEFCGYFCHKNKACSRKIWLARELLRRRICSTCDRYRRARKDLIQGAEFVYHEKTNSKAVTLTLDEATGSLQVLQKEERTVDVISLNQLDGVRRGFSLGGRLRTANYDPLRSLSLTVHRRKQELGTYNLKASSAWTCQMWVDGLLAAKYAHQRVEDQQLATEWYQRRGRTLYSAGCRFRHNYLPGNSEIKQLRRERKLAKNPSSSLCSKDSGVDSAGGSLESLNLDPRETYIDIEVSPDSLEVTSRELHPSLLFSRLCTDSIISSPIVTVSATTTEHPSPLTTSPPPLTTSPLPIATSPPPLTTSPPPPSTKDLTSHSDPAPPCSCHAYQMVTVEWANSKRSRSAGNSPRLSHSGRCCRLCAGHCQADSQQPDHNTLPLIM